MTGSGAATAAASRHTAAQHRAADVALMVTSYACCAT
jgi:hypothetical protein